MPIRNGKVVKWKVTIKGIRSLFTKDESDETAKKVGLGIYTILTSDRYINYFKDFEREGMLNEFTYVQNTEELNLLLNDLYDYCDANLIWIDLNN